MPLNFCLKPAILERAKALASKIAAERGSDMGAQSFHQYLEVDRLRCTLAPSRPAAWRMKRTKVKLSAFAACTLANANLLDFDDLKLFRPQEYYTDEGPWDPISGPFTAALRAFSGMGMGLAEFPSETLKALHIPSGSSRQQSQTSVPTFARQSEVSLVGGRSAPPTSPEQSQTGLNVQESLARDRSPPSLPSMSSPTSNIGSGSMPNALQDRLSPKPDEPSRSGVRSRAAYGSGEDNDMLRRTGPHTSKGLGRFAKALVQSPMELSVGITKGFHNVPKLWGDDTVRPQEQVSDFKSGVRAVGREFGFGWYDGVTGLVTQPWKGAQKEGTSGFFKGIGKGVGGFVAKPGAALVGILSHPMKGLHKEVQKLFGGNVQNYIIASRAAQGYEEWLQSSDAEKQDVIVRWNLIQKYLKKSRDPDEMLRDVLEAQRKTNMEDREASQNGGRNASSAQSAKSGDAPTDDNESAMLAMSSSQSSLRLADTDSAESLEAAEINETILLPVQETSREDVDEVADVFRAIQQNVSQLQRQRQEAADHHAAQENSRKATAASEAQAQQPASDALEYEKQLKQVMAQSLREQRQRGSDRECEWEGGLRNEEDVEFEPSRDQLRKVAEEAAVVAGGSHTVQRPSSYDPGHLEGTTQSEFQAQHQGQQGEKTTQEMMEEEIVMEYVKKQSLLEMHHRKKGKGRATAAEDADDEDFQTALKLSMQGPGVRPNVT